jgi:hypothetical protein
MISSTEANTRRPKDSRWKGMKGGCHLRPGVKMDMGFS